MRYRKIDPRIWKDEKFLTLNQTEKLTTMYCLSSAQTNRIGLFNFSPAQAAEDLNLDLETFVEGFRKVCERLNWRFDKESRVLYLPTWWKYNPPENPNVLIGNLRDLHEIPKTPLIQEFLSNVQYLPETLHETFQKGLPKRLPNQEQEQEQEQHRPKAIKAGRKSEEDYTTQFVTFYNAYPRKANKKAAFRVWRGIALDNGLFEKIITALEQHKKSDVWRRDNGKFIPYPASWLNGERWEDEMNPEMAATPKAEPRDMLKVMRGEQT